MRVRKMRQLTWLYFSNVCTKLMMQCRVTHSLCISSIIKESLFICLHIWNNEWIVYNGWKSMQCRMKEHAFRTLLNTKKDSLYDSNKVLDLTWGHLTVSWVFSRFSYNVPAPGISRQYIITWSQIFFFLSYFYIKNTK